MHGLDDKVCGVLAVVNSDAVLLIADHLAGRLNDRVAAAEVVDGAAVLTASHGRGVHDQAHAARTVLIDLDAPVLRADRREQEVDVPRADDLDAVATRVVDMAVPGSVDVTAVRRREAQALQTKIGIDLAVRDDDQVAYVRREIGAAAGQAGALDV